MGPSSRQASADRSSSQVGQVDRNPRCCSAVSFHRRLSFPESGGPIPTTDADQKIFDFPFILLQKTTLIPELRDPQLSSLELHHCFS